MKPLEHIFLDLITYSLFDDTHPVTFPTTQEEWEVIHKIAGAQKLWPMIFEKVCDTPEYMSLPQNLQMSWMQEAFAHISQQVTQSEELSRICGVLQSEGIKYVILKGISCRRYYPNPDSRPSGDEDILIDWRDYEKCDALLKRNGYICEDDLDLENVQDKREAHYIAENGTLYLEVHFNAIGRENQRQQRLNAPFDDALSHVEMIEYENSQLVVFEPTYQVMHLLSHFYRHLYEAGVGLRQMLDVLITISTEGERINWNIIEEFLKKTEMRKIFAAVLNVGVNYFHIDLGIVPKILWNKKIKPEPMLEDMFDGGIYGYGENGERKLAENFTLDIDTKHNRFLRVIFPAKQRLANRYPVLHKHPARYPMYIVIRWLELWKKHAQDKESRKRLKEQVEVGQKRRKILERYKG